VVLAEPSPCSLLATLVGKTPGIPSSPPHSFVQPCRTQGDVGQMCLACSAAVVVPSRFGGLQVGWPEAQTTPPNTQGMRAQMEKSPFIGSCISHLSCKKELEFFPSCSRRFAVLLLS